MTAQDTKISKKDTAKKTTKSYYFDLIDPKFDLSSLEKVARLKGFCTHKGQTNLAGLFNDFWKMANGLGANSFIIDSTEQKLDSLFVHISIYHLTLHQVDTNFNLYPKNMIYVFGDLDSSREKGRKIQFNSQEKVLMPLKYISYQNKVKEKTIISNGGFTGTKVKIKGKEGRLPTFLSLQGFRIGPSASINQVGLSFSTGRINPVEQSFGQFLIRVLEEMK